MNVPGRVLVASALALAAVCSVPSTSLAGFPEPANWTTPALIPVVGHDANGVPDSRGGILIVARDLANLPMPGVLVELDFSACTELQLCADPHDPDATVDCGARRVHKFTDQNGEVRFRVIGCSSAVPGTPGASYNCAQILGDGELKASPSVAIYDLTGCNGLGPADLSAWLDDFFGGLDPARADYDGTGSPLGPSDLALWLKAFFDAGSIANCSNGGPCAP